MTADKKAGLVAMLENAHKIATALILAGILYFAGSVDETQKNLIKLTEQVHYLTQIIQEGKADRYTPADANRDLSLRDQRLGEIERQMRELDKRRGDR